MRKLTWVHTQVRYTELQNRCIEGTAMNYHYTGLAGAPIALIAVIMLVTYSRRYETHTGATERMREVHV